MKGRSETENKLLSLEELTAEVLRFLQEYRLVDAQQDNRVSPVPDLRTIRYYSTLGLVDRPVPDPPRQAKYRSLHVWQLLAIKALQGAQLSLAEVQAKLYGMTETELRSVVEAIGQRFTQEPKAQEEFRSVTWREYVISPGVKILLTDGWTCSSTEEKLRIEERIGAVLAANTQIKSDKGTTGGANE